MNYKDTAERYVREQLPELMELKEHTVGPGVSKGKPGFYYAYMDEKGYNQHSKVFETKEETMADMFANHSLPLPILLNHWVMLLGAGSYWWDLETRTLSYLRYQAQPSVAFNLITGQPASPADYKAFCEIVGITSEDKK